MLEIEIKNGQSSKNAQFKELARYCNFEKIGHKFNINEIYNTPLPKIENRGKSPGSRNNHSVKPLYITNPLLASQWLIDENGMKILDSVTRRSSEKYWWKCPDCNLKVNSSPMKRLRLSHGYTDEFITCPYCSLSNEAKPIYKFLYDIGINFETEYTFDDLRGLGNGKLRFDFAIFNNQNNLSLLIEYDGKQHHEQIDFFCDNEEFKNRKIHDEKKDSYCVENDIPLLRVSYLDSISKIKDIITNKLITLNTISLSQLEEIKMKNEFRLMSVNVIAYLKMKGIKPIRIEKNDQNSVSHYFENTDELHFYLKEYKKDKNLQSFIKNLTETRQAIKRIV
ncbi:DUF5659 domain-containing protein [Metabacillus sp. Hm71]|uniref:DUF5659 domain-containing protein n=1 Tax=Metabacillus sp. Hm71 TaxID=3450743 RepID=UPI003F41EA33